ncbi:hypothetical protein [Tropicimonas isoalkanivorans]|uniref:HdeA/HdeB family protein n=1 Tax=Tropicimonas isoalkanivorans TaxID=441112 RepID=A0A1I1NKY2_9RHOB|nr:hypothetical protein [Tropicimonas isoalkanivorans]SFC95393.1 hypothetical protein SAMN04488094_1122 [Tropicimonas isoalkanivorans]
MSDRVKLLMSAIALAIALPGAASALTAVEEQRSVLLECKRMQGVGGAAYLEQWRGPVSDITMSVRIVPYDRVTFADADAINACASRKLGLGPVDAGLTARQRTVVRSIRAPGGYYRTDCGRSPSILYKGDLYCQWARR